MTLGRPRSFDVDAALDMALQVFWRKGYAGTSLAELTTAMGINRPSLYAAFGNKETLFRRALERYVSNAAAHIDAARASYGSRGRSRVVERRIGKTCLPTWSERLFLVQAASACGDDADPLRREAVKYRAKSEKLLRERFERAIVEGDLPRKSNAADLAKYVTTVMHGMSIQSAGGATRDELQRVAALALEAMPQ